MLKGLLVGVVLLLAVALVGLYVVGRGTFGSHEGPGRVVDVRRPVDPAPEGPPAKQILFGDLHVHTTVSFDAFLASLPIALGEGSHPQADACDFARYCSALDFWSINDHAEAITPRHWNETVEAIRQCNEVAGDPANPDSVAFLGWEWTQVGQTPDRHYGHKNVVLAHTDDERIPPRPVAARGVAELAWDAIPGPLVRGVVALWGREPRYHDAARYFTERAGLSECAAGELNDDCLVLAETPEELFAQLDEWGQDAIVIPHGTTWGFYTPSGSSWDKQLSAANHDPERQTLMEIYSGHGNSEEYRDWREVEFDDDGNARCPELRPDYLPRCQQAGRIVKARCRDAGEDETECEERAAEARVNAAAALGQAHLTVAGYDPAEWLDAGQCRDCAEPAFNYRPGGAAQYVMALRNFDDPENPLRFRFGFMASSDNHFARPGTGYKEVRRRGFTESNRRRRASGAAGGAAGNAPPEEPAAESRTFDRESTDLRGFQLFEGERQSSFFLTGGLVAAHARGRDRGAIWDAFERREVYGTSGPRILLWFDLLNPPGSRGERLPMGGETRMAANPIFRARALGSYQQEPGCPSYAVEALSAARLEHICKGECYHPSDRRRLVTRIEVIRIRPQATPGEPIAGLVEDPWRVFACQPDPAGCTVTFSDPDFEADGRDALYYVRAIEEPKPVINAANLRCERDEAGNCLRVDLCGGPDALEDDCLAPAEPRAWSSPIFVDWEG